MGLLDGAEVERMLGIGVGFDVGLCVFSRVVGKLVGVPVGLLSPSSKVGIEDGTRSGGTIGTNEGTLLGESDGILLGPLGETCDGFELLDDLLAGVLLYPFEGPLVELLAALLDPRESEPLLLLFDIGFIICHLFIFLANFIVPFLLPPLPSLELVLDFAFCDSEEVKRLLLLLNELEVALGIMSFWPAMLSTRRLMLLRIALCPLALLLLLLLLPMNDNGAVPVL